MVDMPLSITDYEKLFGNEKGITLRNFSIGQNFCKELTTKGIPYFTCITHPEVVSCLDSKSYYLRYYELFGKDYSICKHLFLHERKGLKRHFLVVVDDEKNVDLKELKVQLQSSKLEFCSSDELKSLLNTYQGNVSLFHTKFDISNQVEIVIDKELLDRQLLAFHPLYNGMSLFLTPDSTLSYLNAIGKSASIIDVASKNDYKLLEKTL